MQRFTTVLKSTTMEQMKQSLPSKNNIYVKKNLIKSSNESSSPVTTNSDSNSSDNNETVTLTNSTTLINSSPRYRPARRFFTGKSKSAAVSRSTSNTSRIMAAEKIYVQDSSEDQLSTSDTDDLNSDEEDDSKLVYKTCLESPPNKSIYLKKSLSRPEFVFKNYNYSSSNEKSDSTNRRFIKNNNRLKTSKSMSHCKNITLNQDDDEDLENDEDMEQSLYYRQLDGHMKRGKLSRFKVIKSKSNSALQTVRNNFNRQYVHQNDMKQNISTKQIKGNQRDDNQITDQLQLNDLAERLKFIEQKLLQNEMHTGQYSSNNQQTHAQQIYKPQNHSDQNYSNHLNQIYPSQNNQTYPSQNNQTYSSQYNQNIDQTNSHQQINFQPNFQKLNYSSQLTKNQQIQDDTCLKNGQFKACIHPSISFGDCSEINVLNTKKNKRHFFSSAKSAVKNSKSIPSLFIPSSNQKEKSTVDKLSNLPGSSIKTSSSKIWLKKPLNILNNLVDTVDDKILKWHSSKSVKSSSSSTSIRSNSISSTSNLMNKRNLDQQKLINDKSIYGPIFKKDNTDTKSLSNKFMNSFSRKNSQNSQNNQSNASSNGDLTANRSGSNNSSRFSSTKHLEINQLETRNQLNPNNNLKPQKARAFSAPTEEIFNLLTLPFIDEDNCMDILKNHNSKDNLKNSSKNNSKNNSKDDFKNDFEDNYTKSTVKPSKSYKEINSQALKEIEAFEKLLTDKFNVNNLN